VTPTQWILAVLAAAGVGLSKAGLAGVGLFHVVIFAFLFGARDSTGVVLPMLLVGDVYAVSVFRQHARWDYIRRMLPPVCLGVVIGALSMRRLNDNAFKPVVGWIILALAIMQVVRWQRPDWFGRVPHSPWFAWTIGLFAGVTTMLANAAGPIIALYSLSIGLPKFEFVGTSAWLFLIVNLFKVPFSVELGLIHRDTLWLNLVLLPAILIGLAGGRWLTARIPQRMFDRFLLVFAAAAALRLIGVF
jgi:uncharacterized membrane protein YfcA